MKKQAKRAGSPTKQDDEVYSKWEIAYRNFTIESWGITDKETPLSGVIMQHQSRESIVVQSDKFVLIRTKFKLSTTSADGPTRIETPTLWVSVLHEFEVKSLDGEMISLVTSDNLNTIKSATHPITNLAIIAHTSMRGVVAALVRGTKLNDFVPALVQYRSILKDVRADQQLRHDMLDEMI